MNYVVTSEQKTIDGIVVYRIRGADGRPGGFLQSESNLSQSGTCWLHGDSAAFEDCTVCDDAQIYGLIRGNARAMEAAEVFGQASGNVVIKGRAKIFGAVSGQHIIGGDTVVYGVLD